MDFDPNAATGERKRSGPRWYSRVAFFVIALLLLLNTVAMFVNAEANEKEACYARAHAAAEIWGKQNSSAVGAFQACDKRYVLGPWSDEPDG